MRLEKRSLTTVLLFVLALLGGCAAQQQAPIALDSAFYGGPQRSVGVYLAPIPKPDLGLPGAGCLLCLAAAAAMNSSLDSHIDTFSVDELEELDQRVADRLAAKGMQVRPLKTEVKLDKLAKTKPATPRGARIDHRPLREQLGVDFLYVIRFDRVGGTRQYANYVPVSAPSAGIAGTAYLVDLTTNEYNLYEIIAQDRFTDGEWDEPGFPGFTNAYYQAVAATVDQVLRTVN